MHAIAKWTGSEDLFTVKKITSSLVKVRFPEFPGSFQKLVLGTYGRQEQGPTQSPEPHLPHFSLFPPPPVCGLFVHFNSKQILKIDVNCIMDKHVS